MQSNSQLHVLVDHDSEVAPPAFVFPLSEAIPDITEIPTPIPAPLSAPYEASEEIPALTCTLLKPIEVSSKPVNAKKQKQPRKKFAYTKCCQAVRKWLRNRNFRSTYRTPEHIFPQFCDAFEASRKMKASKNGRPPKTSCKLTPKQLEYFKRKYAEKRSCQEYIFAFLQAWDEGNSGTLSFEAFQSHWPRHLK